LRLLPFPMEFNADRHIVKRERSFVFLRGKSQFPVQVSVPQDASFAAFYRLLAPYEAAFGRIGGVEGEMDTLPAHDAYADFGFRAFM